MPVTLTLPSREMMILLSGKRYAHIAAGIYKAKGRFVQSDSKAGLRGKPFLTFRVGTAMSCAWNDSINFVKFSARSDV
jgi:hypothetical protein